MLVAGFTSHMNIDHAHEVANEVRRICDALNEYQTMAQTYNTREHLFGIPVTNVSERASIKRNYVEIHFISLELNKLGEIKHLSYVL